MQNQLESLLKILCAALLSTASAVAELPNPPLENAGGARPASLSPSDWSAIRQTYEDERHKVIPVVARPGTWEARNPGQGWVTHFDGRSFVAEPAAGGWQWGLQLVNWGFAGAERTIEGQAEVRAEKGRVTYDWGAGLEEWYVNDRRGLEHGYTVHRRPEGVGPLQFAINVRGGLTPALTADGRGVRFLNESGAAAVTYTGLKVWDADGQTLAAQFEKSGQRIRLKVFESGARYPLTIDPLAQQAYLKASNTDAGDVFGGAVAISGDTVIVGAPSESSSATGVNGDATDNSASSSGAAYVFVRNGAVWTQQAYLKASNTDELDLFGVSVAISGDTAVVGARSEKSNATGVNGDESNDSLSEAGAAYVFVRNGTTWTQQAYLKASNTGAGDRFGQPVAISGDTVVVGAVRESSNATGVNGDEADNSLIHAGAAYVFVRNGTTWSQQAYLKASNTDELDTFGDSVAVSGDTIVVSSREESSNATGVNGDDSNNGRIRSGAAYVYVRNGTTWSQQAYLKASNTDANDIFGTSVAISGDTIVAGAPRESSSATGVNGDEADNSGLFAGAAYVYVRNGTTWSQQAYLKASNTDLRDQFGSAVSVSGDTLVVGSVSEGSNATGVNGDQSDNSVHQAGAAYVFVRNGTSWSQHAYLKASNPDASDFFGGAVAVSGDTVVAGAVFEGSNASGVNGDGSDNSAASAGAVYIFDISSPPDIAVHDGAATTDPDVASGATIDFGMVNVNGGMVERSFNLENTGTGSLDFTRIVISGILPPEFTLVGTVPTTIDAGSSAVLTVRFDPLFTGVRLGVLSIESNDPDESPYFISMNGTGVDNAAVGGRVFQDTNTDGIQDAGETGVDNLSVELLDAGRQRVATATTSGGGVYSFANLTPADYFVKFIPPANHIFSAENQGSDDTLDSDPDEITGITEAITLASGQNKNDVDAGVSVPVPPLSTVGVLTANSLDLQTGLFIQEVTINNPTPISYGRVRITATLSAAERAANIRLFNASGTDGNGNGFADFNTPIPSGGSVTFRLEYHVPDRTTVPAPVLSTDLLPATAATPPTGTQLSIDRQVMRANGSFVVEFTTLQSRTYHVQYSENMTTWQTAAPPVTGTGSRVQWVDNGPPKTASLPGNQSMRVYRIVLEP